MQGDSPCFLIYLTKEEFAALQENRGERRKPMRRQITSIYQLKIALKRVVPQIYRRVQVPSDITLDALHMAIQVAMGWTDSHLHSFSFVDGDYSMPFNGDELLDDTEDETGVKLSDLIVEPKNSFEYTYDFGDDWEHKITLEKIVPPAPGATYPVCLAGKRACPPEDCGGVWGYASMLEILADPKHPEYKETREWIGGKFDAEAFNMEKVNRMLKKLQPYV